MNTIVMSDIHIGTNYKTCWYQKDIHEPYMLAALDWIIQNANQGNTPIHKLVFLGDLFDFWTYPPDQQPPSINDILNANPDLFGPGCAVAQVVAALNGNVFYLHGNHDITITQNDLNQIPTGQYQIQLVDDVYPNDDGIVYTHGHLYTMFNAPDPRYPGQVPVGHFVTRAISYMLDNTLPPGQTAANLANQGSPYGFSLPSLIPGLASQFNNPSITNILLDYICQRCGLNENSPILMADGSTTNINAAKAKYDGLWTLWANQNGGGEIGNTTAAKAAQADYDGSYMAWFAQKVTFESNEAGAVMGHTHIPKVGIQNSWSKYVNNGFECPSTPDIADGHTHFNLTTIDEQANMQLWQVVQNSGAYQVVQTTAPADQVVYAPFMDYSCYVRITNNSDTDLIKQNVAAQNGYFVVQPPARILAHNIAEFWMQDLTGIHGAEGSVTYSQADGSGNVQFTFGCPTGIFPNYATGGAYFIASSSNPPTAQTPPNHVPYTGHPLFVEFYLQPQNVLNAVDVDMPESEYMEMPVTGTMATPASTAMLDKLPAAAAVTWTPTSAVAQAVDLAGFLYDPTQDIIYSRMDALQRNFGYAYGYDAAALSMSAVIDCEPIFFDYNGKHWMIELWKGQYGLETGCEIGVYNRVIGSSSPIYAMLDATIGQRTNDPTPAHNLYFDCASDNELPTLSSTLYRNGQPLFSRGPQPHWWLTGFKWGVLSQPEDLTMEVSITCLDATMTSALVNALTGMGYQNVNVSGNTVQFMFATPFTYQPRSSTPVVVAAVIANQTAVVASYNALGLQNNDPNNIPGSASTLILSSIATYSATFFAQVVANLAEAAGLDPTALIHTLTQEYDMAISQAAEFLTQAGYSLASWTDSLENVFGINLDFSCIAELSNLGGPYTLTLDDFGVTYGNYIIPPQQTILPGAQARFWLKDPKPSIHGAQGWVQYGYTDGNNTTHTVRFDFDCPTGFYSNNVSITPGTPFNFYTKSGSVNSGWSGMNQQTGGGHPLFIAFVWGNVPPPQ